MDAFLDGLPHAVTGTYRANTSCVEIQAGTKDVILCDSGTGIRDYALSLPEGSDPKTFHIFISHLHWDHIQGFPFFAPAYQAGNRIVIHGFHKETEEAFRKQMDAPCFPVPFSCMQADIEFDIREGGDDFQIESVHVRTIKQQHPGDSWGYRFELGDQSIVYSTDAEHGPQRNEPDYPFVAFFKDADILIYDGQYNSKEAKTAKLNWGHSDHQSAVELSALAKVKQLVLYHHEPSYTDQDVEAIRKAAESDRADLAKKSKSDPIYPLNILSAYDGLILSA